MNDFLLVLTGAGISLVSSVTVTWLQSRTIRRTDVRAAARTSTRQLTSLFIAERDAPADASDSAASASLPEAETMSVTISDRRTRERIRNIIRLLREIRLPELQELSGMRPLRARQILCDHALEVLGSHFRGERLPALPQSVQKMLDVEDEALNIHADGPPASDPTPAATAETPTKGTGTAKAAGSTAPTTKQDSADSGADSGTNSGTDSTRKVRRTPRSTPKKNQKTDDRIDEHEFWDNE